MFLMQIDMKKTGAKIRELCKKNNITVKDIQNELGIGAFQSVYDWFSGKSLPSLDNFFYLSKLLGVHMDDMIEVVKPTAIDFYWLKINNDSRTHLIIYVNRLLQYMSTIQL